MYDQFGMDGVKGDAGGMGGFPFGGGGLFSQMFGGDDIFGCECGGVPKYIQLSIVVSVGFPSSLNPQFQL